MKSVDNYDYLVVGGGIVAGGLQARRGAAGAEKKRTTRPSMGGSATARSSTAPPARAATLATRAPNRTKKSAHHDINYIQCLALLTFTLGSDMLHRVYR